MGSVNRRQDQRIALQLFLNEYVGDRAHRCMATNLSSSGLYVNRLLRPEPQPSRVVGLEFSLPGISEVIWARGEYRFDQVDPYFRSTGIEITGIARVHQRLIHEYVSEERAKQLRRLLAMIRRNRMH